MKKLTLAVSLAALSMGGVAYAHGMMGMKGDLTRAEAQQKAAAMFAKMDTNSDGLLNDADRQARMTQRFDAMDTDKNGAISRDEFMAGHSGMGGKEGHDHKEGAAAKPGGMKMGDGGMGGHGGGMKMGEDGAGGHGGMMRGHGGMHGHRDMLMKMADKNNDGAVSATEFTEAHLAMFDKSDTNKDGTLTSAERKAAMEKMKSEMSAAKPAAPATK